jgi:hypothetical protein
MAEAQAGALQIVQTQQNLVGKALVGGASAITGESSESKSQTGILEQIRDITLKSFRATTKVAETLVNTLNFQKSKEARERDQSAELSKENIKPKTLSRDDVGGDGAKKAEKSAGQFNGTMFALGALTTKLLKPFRGLLTFFKKIIPLSGIFARLGPLASGLLRLSGIGTILFILFKYSDEIIKALTPAIESIQKAFVSLKPAIDFIFSLIDGGIKIAINAIGGAISGIALAIEVVADLFSGVLDGLGQLADGNIIDGLKTILKSIVMAPVNLLKGIGNIIGDFILGLIDALPLPKFLKDKFKGAVEKKETTTGSAGDMAGEASLTTGETIDTSNKTIQTSQTLDDEYYEPEPVIKKIKPKTINQDKPQSMIEVVSKTTETGGETVQTTGFTKDMKQGAIDTYTNKLNSIDDKIKSIEDQFGFPSFEVGNPDYDNLVADESKDNPALGKAWRKYKALHREKFKTIEKIKETQVRPLEDPETTTNRFDRTITKRDLTGEGGKSGNITVVNNQPTSVNTSTNVAKTSVSSSPINVSSGDNYFDRQASSYT